MAMIAPQTRTFKTLVALLGALTIGTLALLALETSPVRGPAVSLAARIDSSSDNQRLAEIFNTERPLDSGKWHNIVIHDSVCEMTGNPEDGCHFIVNALNSGDPGQMISNTARWRRQADGANIFQSRHDYNSDSIGICLVGDFAEQTPSHEQTAALVSLVRSLQMQFRIPPDHVYRHVDLTGANCPGSLFPKDSFRSQLLRLAR